MEVKVLVIIALLLFVFLAYFILVVGTYFFTKADGFVVTRPMLAKKWQLHGNILMGTGMITLIIMLGVALYAIRHSSVFG